MTLELALEKAYASVMTTNESGIATIPVLLGHRTTQPQGGELKETPLPCITITATKQQEMVPNSGVFQMALEIMAEDAAVRESGVSAKLDEIFRQAVRPLLYKPLVQMIWQAGVSDGLKCFGLPERGEATAITFGEGVVQLNKSALFICSNPPE